MKVTRNFKKRGTPDCPIAVAYYTKGRYLPPAPHWHPEIEIAYIKKGRIHCIVDEQTINLSAGDILILSPEQTHFYQTPTEDAEILFFIFSLDALAMPQPHIFQQSFVQPLKEGMLLMPQKLGPTLPGYEQVVQQLNQHYASFVSLPNYKLNRYGAVVNICLALLPLCKYRADSFPVRVNSNTAIRNAVTHIHDWYFRPLTLKSIASKVHLNPNYLSTLFKEHTGQTITQYLTRTRVDAAVYLLRNSDLNISQIAEKTGFRSESAFYHQFRKLMGTSPRVFRQTNPKKA